MKRPQLLAIALALAVPAVVLAGFNLSHPSVAQGNSEKSSKEAPPPGLGAFIPADSPHPMPEASFTDGEGKAASLADFRGKVTLVNLWATWCEPCIREMPTLDKLAAAMADKDFAVAIISEDRGGAKTVDSFLPKLGLATLKTYLDPK